MTRNIINFNFNINKNDDLDNFNAIFQTTLNQILDNEFVKNIKQKKNFFNFEIINDLVKE